MSNIMHTKHDRQSNTTHIKIKALLAEL